VKGSLAQTLVAVAAILGGARVLGGVAVRLRQPRIGGEMVAGLVVGGALLSRWHMTGSAHHASLVAEPVVGFIDLLGHIGVILYLLLVGLTLSPVELRRNSGRIAAVGLPVVLAAAALSPLAAACFAGARWQLAGGSAALVMAAALMINGFPFVARILQERELLHGGFGATVLGASALLTALPFLLLAVAERRFPSVSVGAAAYVLRLLATVAVGGGAAVAWSSVAARLPPVAVSEGTAVVAAVVAAFLGAWLSLKLLGTGLLGAFMVGVALSRSAAIRSALERALGGSVPVILVPVFIASAGARVDPRMLDASVLAGAAVFTILLVAVATVSGWASSRISGVGASDARAITALLNCRGLMLLVVAVELADHRLIGPRLVAVLFIAAVATTLMTGPLLARAGRLARHGAARDGAQPPNWSLPQTPAIVPPERSSRTAS
jgi:Kef-type K+ transport system membrane component KefB